MDMQAKNIKTSLNSMNFQRFLQTLVVLGVFLTPWSLGAFERPQPEISTGYGDVSAAQGQDFMIVTANPYATSAGYEILKKGGSAVDAAITAQLVLGLVEPQSSGLGGGAFMLHYDAKEKQLSSYDGRETAPDLAGPFLFKESGRQMEFMEAVVGGRAVGVPGVPALLSEAHEIHGKLTWMELFDEPIRLAKEGFEVSPRMARMVEDAKERLAKFPQSAAYFLPGGQPVQAGTVLKNTEYENTLRDYAFYGSSRFYRGELAGKISQVVQNISDNPGLLTPRDFALYEIKKRDPVCGPYRGFIVCSMGEPSSGGLTLLQILAMLEGFDVTNDAKGWSVIAQASALAFADRGRYMADPDFANTPGVALLEPEYIKARAALINPEKPLEKIAPGKPESWDGPLYDDTPILERPGTTHISVVDKDGNIVSMTSSIEGAFGSHVMVDGFLLNNQLTDFAFNPLSGCKSDAQTKPPGIRAAHERQHVDANVPGFDVFIEADACEREEALVANMAEGGKRPRSSMSPTIVFDKDGAPALVIGSAGGSRIIGYVLQRIIAAIDWGMSMEEAMAMPHILARGKTIEMETTAFESALKESGHDVDVKALNSGLTAIQIDQNSYLGVADPRREGIALGE